MAVPAPSPVAVQRERYAAARRPKQDIEGPIHRSILSYLRRSLPHGFVVHHSPNGGMSKGEVGRSKGLGTIAGWPDLQIVGQVEGRVFLGFMEAKAPGGKLSEAQVECRDRLLDCGAPYRVVRSIEDARKAVSDWHLPSTDSLIVRREA